VIESLRRHAWWLVPLLLVDVCLIAFWMRHRARERSADVPVETVSAPAPVRSQLADMRFPTDQGRLLEPEPVGVFQPTASGNLESALYGSVRTGQTGKKLYPRFHEGIDIAAMERDRSGRPLDQVYAAASGRVGFVNLYPGNSDYGKYIVLTHADPVGTVYTLYAHLASIEAGIRAGVEVTPGTLLGTMGNTALDPIPMARAHTHFEVGLIQNGHFDRWARRQRNQTPGGIYNGLNLFAVDPLEVYRVRLATPDFSMAAYLATLLPAFEIALPFRRQWDFFERYPSLWKDAAFSPGAVVVAVAESGLPIAGRSATPEEAAKLGRSAALVLDVREDVLGRNGRRLIARGSQGWDLTESGKRWLEILAYHP
jgi:peptidoglycan LD-endopeptidase LytH